MTTTGPTLHKLPTTHLGYPNWKELFCAENIGKTFACDRITAKTSYDRAVNYGYTVKTQIRTTPCTLTIVASGQVPPLRSSSTQYAVQQAAIADNDIPRKLREARENLAYWNRQKSIRENHAARVEAGARVIAWKQQIERLEAALITAH